MYLTETLASKKLLKDWRLWMELVCVAVVVIVAKYYDRRGLENSPRKFKTSIGDQVISEFWVTNNQMVHIIWETNWIPGRGMVIEGRTVTNKAW